MRKVELSVEEVLKYRRKIIIDLPDYLSEEDLEKALSKAEKEEYLTDFMYTLKNHGIEAINGWDDDLNSPDFAEVECDDYRFLPQAIESTAPPSAAAAVKACKGKENEG